MVDEDRRTVSQLVLASWPPGGVPEIAASIDGMPVGGFELHRSDITDPHAMRQSLRAVWKIYAEHKLPPPFVAVTEEGGTVGRFTHYPPAPSARSVGESGSVETAFRLGSLTGRMMASQGFNWCFGPVLDVLTEPRNPVIGTRAFGTDDKAVARYATAWLQGLRHQRVMATGKHFPGHGMTHVDSHITQPVVALDEAQLRIHLAPYQAAIAGGMDAVMTAHVLYQGWDQKIATLSRFWLQDVLRTRLQFTGLVVSDGLGMQGLAVEGLPRELAATAVMAGIDVLAVGGVWDSARGWIDGLLDAYRNDPAVRLRVDRAAGHIRKVKSGLLTPAEWPVVPSLEEVQEGYDEVLGPLMQDMQRALERPRFVTGAPMLWAGSGRAVEVEEVTIPEDATTEIRDDSGDSGLDEAVTDPDWTGSQAVIVLTDNLWQNVDHLQRVRDFSAQRNSLHIVVSDPIDVDCVEANERVYLYGNRHLVNRVGLQRPSLRKGGANRTK